MLNSYCRLFSKMRLLFSVFFAALLIACSKDNRYYCVDSEKEVFVESSMDTINGELLFSLDAIPNGIECYDSIVIIANNASAQKLFDFYDVASCEKIFSFGSMGHSNNEFINPPFYSYFDFEGEDRIMCIPDDRSTKILDFNETVKQKKGVFKELRKHKYDGEDYFFVNKDTVIVRKDLSYIDPRDKLFFPPVFTIYDQNKKTDISIYPEIIKTNNFGLLHFLYSSAVRIKPDKTKLVESLSLLGITNIIDIKTGKVLGIKENNTYGFEDIERISGCSDIEQRIIAYTHGMYATDNHVFLLQDRCSVSELQGNEVSPTPTLLILNWDGDLISNVCLDRGIYSIACDEDVSVLYGFDSDGRIYKYNIYKYLNK